MKYISIEALRKHCNSYQEDDDLVEFYWEVSLGQIEKDVNRSLSDFENENGELPSNLIIAGCLLTAHLYKNREATGTVSFSTLPFGYEAFVKKSVHFDPDWRKTETTITSSEGTTSSSDEATT